MHLRIRTKLILAFLLVSLLPLLAALLLPLYINSSIATDEMRARLETARDGLVAHADAIRATCAGFGRRLLADPRFVQLYEEGNPRPRIGSRDRIPAWLEYARRKALLEPGDLRLIPLPLHPDEYEKYRRLETLGRRLFVYSSRYTSSSGGPAVAACLGEAVPLPDDRYGPVALFIGTEIWKEEERDGSLEYEQRYVENLAQTFGVNGKLLGERTQAYREVVEDLGDKDRVSLLEEGRWAYNRRTSISGVRSHIVLVPLASTEPGYSGLVMFWLPQQPVVTMWASLKNSLILSLVGAACFAVLLGLFVSRSFSRPINALYRQVIRLSQGEPDFQVRVTSRDELGELGQAFNTMATRLNHTLAELRASNETIEQHARHLDRMVRELERTRNFVESILRQVRSGVLTISQLGIVTTQNPVATRLLGLAEADGGRPEEMPPRHWRDAIADSTLAAWIEQVQRTRCSIEHQELLLKRPDGSEVPVEVTITPLQGESGADPGSAQGLLITFVDLSNVKLLQERLRRQERMAALGQLTAGVAHELRNPLGIIKGCAELLQPRFGGQPGEAGLIGDIIEETDRLSRVITDFLAFARPSEPRLIHADLNELVERLLDQFPRAGASATYTYVTELDPQLPLVAVDPDQIRQVLLNLLLNARDAMPEGGRIVVRTRVRPPDQVTLEVIDQGQGIAPEFMEQIFNPFFTTKDSGTGLGLSIVHTIIDQHGGSIEVDSKPRQGSTFRVVLPARGVRDARETADAAALVKGGRV